MDPAEVLPISLPVYGDKNEPRLDPTNTIEVYNGALLADEVSLILLKI